MSEATDVARYNLKIIQGATLDKTFTWKDSAGSPISLTGYTAKLQIRSKHGDANVLLELTQADGITLGGAAGTVRIQRSAAQTTVLGNSFKRAVYDLELTSGAAVVKRFLEGDVIVSPEVTV